MIMRMILSKNHLKRKIKSYKTIKIKKIQNLIKSLFPKNQKSSKRNKIIIKRLRQKKKRILRKKKKMMIKKKRRKMKRK